MVSEPTRGYWCECWTEGLTSGTSGLVLLASFDAHSATQAVRWIAVALRTITSALDPSASAEAWSWLDKGRTTTTKSLLHGEPCAVSINTRGTRITWTARPALFLSLANRRAAELPTCTERFQPHPGF
nr:hypothetical protein [Streptomyces pathocidini]